MRKIGWGLALLGCMAGYAGPAPQGVDCVDPFIGSGYEGHATPAAACPMGLVQAGPDTWLGDYWHCAGYKYEDTRILGFSQTHLSGTGCADLGDLRLLPLGSERTDLDIALKGGLRYEHAHEQASPGYYSVRLEGDVAVEIAAAPHSAIYRMTFDKAGVKRLVVDCQWQLVNDFKMTNHVLSSVVKLDGRTGVSGELRVKHWVEREYGFAIAFDRAHRGVTELPRRPGERAPRYVFEFDVAAGETLAVKVGLSSGCGENPRHLTLPERARANLTAEIPGWDFEGVRSAARDAWAKILDATEIEGTDEERRSWHTAVYHLYYQPNNIADVGAKPFHSTFSCWDTFRAAGPLYTILTPKLASGFVDSMLEQGKISGYLPIWTLWGRDNQCMIGVHSIPMIVDAWLKGTWKGDAEAAYRQVRQTLLSKHDVRRKENWDLYDQYGYYPYDIINGESVSRTLECCYNDWCAAVMAERLGHLEDAAVFRKRANYWKNVFDPSIGLMRGRDTKGRWREPFNPFAIGVGMRSNNDFTEANAYQYAWHVLHDPQGLIAMMGGAEKFTEKLEYLFEMPSEGEGQGYDEDCTGFVGQYVHGNEPSHHVAYYFTLAGHPEKTAERVRQVLDLFYAPRPDGLCGNDDCGQMSAWYLFSLMGFYPFDPCGGEYVIGAPQLPKMTLRLENGKTFTVVARNLSRENLYVKSVTLNGKPVTDWKIRHADIMAGGTLVFEMGRRDPQPLTVIIDASKVPAKEAWARENAVPVLQEWLPKITALLDGPDAPVSTAPVRLVLEPDGRVPAWAISSQREMHLNLKWAEESPAETLGALVHELSHVVQCWGGRAPTWVSEGVVDWVRWFNYESDEEKAKQVKLAERKRKHDLGYRETAAFFDWIVRKYDPSFIRRLNVICRSGKYDDMRTWVELTSRTQEQLANEWRQAMPPREKPEAAFDVATYNIRRAGDKGDRAWEVRFPQLLGVIAARRLDLIGFQEVYPEQLEDLRSGLVGWEGFGTGRNADGRDEASPIFWRTDRFEKLSAGQFWLSEKPDVPGSKSWNAAFPRVCTWVKLRDRRTGRKFAYFNCHADHKSILARQEGVRLILRRIGELAPSMPVIFGGDFNDDVVDDKLRKEVLKKDFTRLSPDTSEHPVNLVRAVLKDTCDISKTPHMGTNWTDNGYYEKHVKRIDYLFVTDGVQVLTHETTCDRPNGIFPSDHEAVVARIML